MFCPLADVSFLKNVYCVAGITNTVAKDEDNFLSTGPFNIYHSKAIKTFMYNSTKR
jgi:hypothetical protein